MKKIVIASDSFKGSLSSAQVAASAAKGIRSVMPGCEIVELTIADGGEGTAEAYIRAVGGSFVSVQVCDPLMRPVNASYGLTHDGLTAIVDTASASGLTLLSPAERNPMTTSTFGTGELMLDALRRGCRRIILGTGGSATNDAGTGLLSALGCRFADSRGNELPQGGRTLADITCIDTSGAVPELTGAEIIVAYDVDVPFYGAGGAAETFAPQKGADSKNVKILDAGMEYFAGVLEKQYGRNPQALSGSGSAGGTAGTLAIVLKAKLIPGIELIMGATKLTEQLSGADLVITGEGRMDRQTLTGKAPYGVLKAAATAGVPAIAITGSVSDPEMLLAAGFAAIHSINTEPFDPHEAMKPSVAALNVERTAAKIAREISSLK